MVTRGSVVAVGVALALAGCGSSSSGSPSQTIDMFLHAAAAGDSTKACAQLSAKARRQVVSGTSCEQGIKLAAALYRRLIGRIKIAGLQVHGDTATGQSVLDGKPIAMFQLTRTGPAGG